MADELAMSGGMLSAGTAREALITLVLDGLDSEHSRRAYGRALADFLEWHSEQGRPPLSKALIQRYKAQLQAAGLGAASINLRLSALRKLATEAADNGVIGEATANGIKRIPGVKCEGTRAGNWLTLAQAQALLNAPDISTLKGLRDRAILAVLLGCGLRRTEAAGLTWDRIAQREGRWVIVDLVGKRGKVRSVPMPAWCKAALDAWASAAGLGKSPSGAVFRSVNKGDRLAGESMTPQAIRDVVHAYAEVLGLGEIAPHDLRRTFAKLARNGGADLEQIQLSLGHASIQTTQRYLGTRQDWGAGAPADRLGLRLEPLPGSGGRL